MKKILFSLIFFFFIAGVSAGNINEPVIQDIQDTLKDGPIEDEIIADIITTKKAPQKDKVQYFSQLTKYGFKNLFNKYRYNSSLPYSSQVNPNAEVYMQDYLRSHSSSLVKMKTWGMPYFNLIDNIFMQYGLP